MNIAICDDEVFETEHLEQLILTYAQQRDYDLHCRRYTSGVRRLSLPASYAPTSWDDRTLTGTQLDAVTVAEGNETLFTYNDSLYMNRIRWSGNGEEAQPALIKMTTAGADRALHPETYLICDSAIAGLSNLTQLTIPAAVEGMEHGALRDLPNLKTIILEKRASTLGFGAFYSCPRFTTVVTANDDPIYETTGGALLNKETRKVILVPNGVTALLLDETVAGIDYYGFGLPENLETLTILNPDFAFESGVHATGNTTIIGHTGSTAELFALENNCVFESLEGVTIENVAIDVSEAQNVFTQFEWLDFNNIGLRAIITYSDGSTKTVTKGFGYEGNLEVYRTGSHSVTVTYRDLKAAFPYTVVRKVIPVDYIPGDGLSQYHATYTYSGEQNLVELISEKTAPGEIRFSMNDYDADKIVFVIAEDEALQNVLYTYQSGDSAFQMDFEAGKTYYIGITADASENPWQTVYLSFTAS